ATDAAAFVRTGVENRSSDYRAELSHRGGFLDAAGEGWGPYSPGMRTQQHEPERAGAGRYRRELVTWHVIIPVLGIVQLAVSWRVDVGPALVTIAALLLAGCVFAAVHHAEVVAARIGEPFGSLVLAIAVTVIEVGLVVIM